MPHWVTVVHKNEDDDKEGHSLELQIECFGPAMPAGVVTDALNGVTGPEGFRPKRIVIDIDTDYPSVGPMSKGGN